MATITGLPREALELIDWGLYAGRERIKFQRAVRRFYALLGDPVYLLHYRWSHRLPALRALATVERPPPTDHDRMIFAPADFRDYTTAGVRMNNNRGSSLMPGRPGRWTFVAHPLAG